MRNAIHLAAALVVVAMSTATSFADEFLAYVGTYTGAKSKGIYAFRFDSETGKAGEVSLAAETKSPSFLAIHPNNKYLYAVGETDRTGEKPGGAVTAFSIGIDGNLEKLSQASSGGAGPCHLVVDRSGKYVLVANYGGGSIAALPIDEQGRVGEATAFIQHKGSSVNPQRQREPHAHSINLDRANRFAVAADLGLDKVLVYRFDAARGSLTANDPPSASVKPGAGPRHFAFHPSGKFAYVINEIQVTVTAFAYDAERGELKELQTISTLPEGTSVKPQYSTAEVQVHPSGTFLYGSNRGHDSIAVFAIDGEKGTLAQVQVEPTRGKTPRNFAIDPTGRYLLAENQSSDTIAVFAIDQKTGKLSATGQIIEVPAPVCIRFVPAR
jgi:6-phosphogluconolactonase